MRDFIRVKGESMNRCVLVTGGSRGIGRDIALRFGKAGYKVIVNYNKSKSEADSLIEQLLKNEVACQAIQADVSNPYDVERMKREVAYGFVDTVVNNAGIAHFNLLQNDTPEDFDRVIGVDLKGAWLVTRAFLPDMLKNNFGRIINISSFWAERGSCTETLYSAAKAGLVGLTKALSRETGENITVNAISAGLICTEMNNDVPPDALIKIVDATPAGRIGRPRDVSHAALFLADEKSDFITGAVLSVDGGY